MIAAKLSRSGECGKPEAVARFVHAQKFLEAADLVAGEAADFSRKIKGGEKPGDALTQLISLKDTAQYGVINISDAELKIAMRRARTLVEFAQSLFDAS